MLGTGRVRRATASGALIAALLAVALGSPEATAAEARCRTYVLVVEDSAEHLVDRAAIEAELTSTPDLARAITPDADLTVRIRARTGTTATKSVTGRLNDMFGGRVSVTADWTSSATPARWQALVSGFEARSSGERFAARDAALADAQRSWRRAKRETFTAAVAAAMAEVARGGCPQAVVRQEVVPPRSLPPREPPPSKTASVQPPGTGDGGAIRSLVLGLGGVVLLVTILIVVMRVRGRLGRFQQLVLLVLLALAAGAAVSILAGQIDVTTDAKLGWGVRATGGLAVFALVLSLGYRFLSGETDQEKSKADDKSEK